MNGFNMKDRYNLKSENTIFEYRRKTYSDMLRSVLKTIDSAEKEYLTDPKKKVSILNKDCIPDTQKPNLSIFYKGVEIPLLYKSNKATISGVNYIPILQLVDNPIHTQKDGEFVIIKTNIKNSFLKIQASTGEVLLTKSRIPLLIIFIASCLSNKVMNHLTVLDSFGYIETDSVNEAEYLVPFLTNDVNEPVIIKGYKSEEPGKWKDFFLNPFRKERIEENLIIFKTCETYKDICDAYARLICKYHTVNKSKKTKSSLSISYVKNILDKIYDSDLTLNGISVFSKLYDAVLNDDILPGAVDIGDLSQKMIRHVEWYPMKISNVRSYPQSNMIVEVFKVEQRLNYDNTLNPISELEMITQIILFGKGALPKESCQSHVRNIHDTYHGIIDPVDSPSGAAIGISLHLVPEIHFSMLNKHIPSIDKNKYYFRNIFLKESEGE